MKIHILFCALVITASLSLRAGTPVQEKAFTDKYKTAFEGKDNNHARIIPLHPGRRPGDPRLLQNDAIGRGRGKDFQDRASRSYAYGVAHRWQSLPLTQASQTAGDCDREKDANGSSTSKTTNSIAEKDGKFVIPVPGPCK
jgi:hypothetical protein